MTYQNPVLRWLNNSSVGDTDVVTAMYGIRDQVHEDFGPIWHTGCREVWGGTAQAGDWVIEILDNSDVQGALGYHDIEQGRPWMKVFAATCAKYGVPWSSCASHEVLEALADPYIERCIQTGSSRFHALEVCDPCESATYTKNGVVVSDFITPKWFDTAAPFNSYDWLTLLSAPLSLLSGGYESYWTPSTGWTQKNAMGEIEREGDRDSRREVYAPENP